ncbi:Cobalt-zinc-cadmium resistance protein CzcA [Planctomycetes bacterium Poly30]|uniref:Cobalt-zinc-cadmium resistance protein CzcA n=1 Tax=Saltatorellus ferox TaxID=2528018 RepID=A0A518EQ44_9BACT|nr:Cobalt-zinc-cadmium resistance protein CzcA [Planctomycetes bacterium Poly30]
MDLSNLYYRNPRLLTLTLMLILVAGFASFQLLPRAEDPELTSRNAQIFTAFPGADASRVEALVTDVVEDMLAEFEEIKEIKSVSRAGLSTVAIELRDEIANVGPVWTEIRDDLAGIVPDLPPGAREPDFVEFELSAYTLLVGLTWELDSTPNRTILGRLAEELADKLRAVPGTHDVALSGAPQEEVLVELDPAQMASLGLDARLVSAAIERSDSKVAAGEVSGATNEIQLEVSGEIESLDRIRDVLIDRGGGGDAFVRLGDIATITKSEVQPIESLALIDGEEGVVVAARMEVGRRVDVWSERARAVTDSFHEALPAGVGGEVLFDQSKYTEERLGNLVFNFLFGAVLVMVVLFFTMGWRSAILVGTALPLTTLMVLQGLRTIGVPLHQMSVTGMIIALGLLIDNAIVVVDEVRHRLQRGDDRAEAVGAAVKHLAVPLFGSTLTTCMAFAPIALMPGGAGEFVGPIALSVILAIACSFFLALTITPALTGLLDKVFPAKGADTFLGRGLYFPRLDRAYSGALGFLFGRPVLAVALAILAPFLGFLAAPRLPEQFFPPADRDQFNVKLLLAPVSSLETTRELALRARDVAVAHPRVERVHLFVGQSSPKYYYNLVETQRDAPFFAQALIQLDGPEDSIQVVRDIQAALDEAVPQAVVLAQQIEQGPPFDAPVEMHLYGPDLQRLRALGDEVRLALTRLPNVTHVRSTLDGGAPKLRLDLDDETARLVGTDNRGVAAALEQSLTGVTGGSLIEATEELPVRVRVGDLVRGSARQVETLILPTAEGWTNLASLGDLTLVPETAVIAHRNRRRVNTTQGFLEAGTLPSEVLGQLLEALESEGFEAPDGYELEVGGESAKRDEAVGNLAGSAALLLVLMAAALVLTFNSFRMAGIIAIVGFLAVGLALLAVAVYGAPFGFMTIVGAMGLIGVAINDSIVVLAALREDEGADRGDIDATVQIVRRASRHVFSTSLTTMAGFAPLIVAGGAFWPPLAVAIAGGVAGATLIAITLVPALHIVVARSVTKRAAKARARTGDGISLATA